MYTPGKHYLTHKLLVQTTGYPMISIDQNKILRVNHLQQIT